MTSLTADDWTDKRTKLAEAIETLEDEFTGEDHRFGDREFCRRQLNVVLYKKDMSEVTDEEDQEEEENLQTTTDLLNKMTDEDDILNRTRQGGTSAFVLDTGADEERGEQVTGVTPSDLRTMVAQVEERREVHIDTSDVDLGDWNEVADAVNEALKERVFIIQSEPSLFRLTEEARKVIREEL